MNFWTERSIELANQRNYLDLLYRVYPVSPNIRREIDQRIWGQIEQAFDDRNSINLIKNLIKLELFPIKDSYVAYLRKDPTALERNPRTVNRIASQLYEMGLAQMYDHCTEPKEANRQMGPMFKAWIDRQLLGIPVFKNTQDFMSTDAPGILNVGDGEMKAFATEYLGYQKDKGLDFVCRIDGKYIIGEAKFITDFGGHQDRQFDDAVATANTPCLGGRIRNADVITIAIMDGVLYIPGRHKYARYFCDSPETTIISSLLLRDFLYSV